MNQIFSNSTERAMVTFIEEYVKNGCHHGCMNEGCSATGKQRMAQAKAILFNMKRDAE